MNFLISNSRSKVFCQWLILVPLLFLFISESFSQMGTMAISTDISSGVITNIDANNEIGVIQFQIDNLSANQQDIIMYEFTKYEGEIVNFGISLVDNKLIVAYRLPSYPNFLLAILDRVNIRGYYLDISGLQTFYAKDGHSAFIR